MGRILQLAGLTIGLAGLLLQFYVTMPAAIAAGRSLPGALVFFFSFFTILTNVAAVLVHAAMLSGRPAWFAAPRVRAGVAVSIAVVSIVYATVLARLWQPQGLMLICDVTLHYLTPAIFVAWWMTAGADGGTRPRDVGLWLAYPLLYLAYVMARAPFAGEVPYPFLSIEANGIGGVATAALMMLGLFASIAAVALLYDRTVGADRRSAATKSDPRR